MKSLPAIIVALTLALTDASASEGSSTGGKRAGTAASGTTVLGQAQTQEFNPGVTLWYETEVTDWRDALPMGNGRLGAMYFGGVKEDRLQFNEETYWTGGPADCRAPCRERHLGLCHRSRQDLPGGVDRMNERAGRSP